MFGHLGRFSARFRWLVILGWIALAVLVTLLAPPFEEVASSDTSDFLPENAPFNQGYARFQQAFPTEYTEGGAVIVVETPSGSVRQDPAWRFLADLTAWLQSDDAPPIITDVLSPAMDIPLLGESLIAPDEQLALISINMSSGVHDDATDDALARFHTYLDRHTPPGVNTYIIGSSPIIRSYSEAALSSVDRTTGVTIVLVVLILLLVYRSPVSPLVPLLTVSLSYLISRGIVAWMGSSLMTVITHANVMLVVVLFGAGTDYCLFLISRFREEMADGDGVPSATARTVHRVGETITSSAGTVIVGFVSMAFAEMGFFNTTGPALAVGVVVMLLAGLTLTPALLATLGQRAFWPGRASHRQAGRLYAHLSVLVSQHPVRTILLIVLVLAPLALYATGQQTTYNMLADLPADSEARLGFQTLDAHMGGGQIQPINVVIDGLAPQTALAEIDRWTERLLAVDGVGAVRSLAAPLGQADERLVGITRVDRQLRLAADLLAQLAQDDTALALTPEDARLALSALPFAQGYLNTLEERFPQVAGDPDLAAIRQTLTGLPTAALSGGLDQALATLQTHLAALAETFAGIESADYLPEALPEGLVAALGGQDPLAALAGRYLTPDRTAARFEVILAGNPYGDEATAVVRELRTILPGGPAAVSGYSVVITDLRDTVERDTLRAFSLVLLGIFIVLLFLLRALVSPLYLILSILLSYGATMGITRLASGLFFGTEALTWWVPFFMFVMLVALGMDYNIFLMGRVKEEVGRHGMREGVHQAVAATGAIITSAGIIMAGTFAAMLAGVITGLKQLGFAVAVGVLLDTFVIRTALVPAIAALLDRWNWWPGRMPQAPKEPEPSLHRPEPRAHAPTD